MATPTESESQSKPEWAMSRREAENARLQREGLPAKKKKWPWIVLLLAVAAGGYYFYDQSQKAKLAASTADAALAAAPVQERVMQLNSAEYLDIAPVTLQRMVKVIGNLQPSRTVALAAEVNGVVGSIGAREGDRVEAGAVLAQINVEQLTLQVALARSNYEATRVQVEQAEANVARTEALVARGAATNTALDETRTGLAAQRAGLKALEDQIRSAELTLSKATVTAPFAASVSERKVEEGGFVGAGSPIFTLVDVDTLEMAANAPVGVSASISAGDRVLISIDGIADQTFTGEVSRVNPVANPGSRTLPVYVTLDNADGQLRGGMFGVGQIIVDETAEAIAIPSTALRMDAQGAHVLVVVNGTLERRAVTTGEGVWAGEMLHVTSGLAAGDRIVALPMADLAPGQRVTIVEG